MPLRTGSRSPRIYRRRSSHTKSTSPSKSNFTLDLHPHFHPCLSSPRSLPPPHAPPLAARRPSVSPRVSMRAAVPDYHPACRPLPTAPPAPSSLHPTTTAPPSPPLYTHTAPPASVCSPRWAPPPIFPHRIFCGVFPLDPFRGFLTQMGWQGAHATKHPCSCQMSRGRDPQCNYHQSSALPDVHRMLLDFFRGFRIQAAARAVPSRLQVARCHEAVTNSVTHHQSNASPSPAVTRPLTNSAAPDRPSPPLYTTTPRLPPASVAPRWAPPPIFPHRIFCGVFPLDPFRGFLTQMGWQGAHATKHPCSCQMSRGRDPQCNYHQSILGFERLHAPVAFTPCKLPDVTRP